MDALVMMFGGADGSGSGDSTIGLGLTAWGDAAGVGAVDEAQPVARTATAISSRRVTRKR